MAWIRSQDKRILLDVNHIIINHYEKGTPPHYDIETFQSGYGWNILGKYSTEEKALKVLDMIQKYIGGKTKYYITKDIGNPDGYHMYDDMDIPINDVEGIVGIDSLTRFGEYEADSVFVRNERLKGDYEILLSLRRYSELNNA